MYSPSILSTALLLLASPYVTAQDMYSKNSPVLQVDHKSYDRLIARSNYTSIVEFYAPWCGHCKNLKPAYEKAAKSLSGIAKVAAVNCDEESNKPFCGSMGVQGFPTLKIVKPPKQAGKKGTAEDYQGPRTANGIADAVADKIFNYVMRVKSNADFDKFVKKTPDRPKGLVFSEKGLVPAFVKTLAIDFLGGVDFGYARSGDKELVAKFEVTKFPAVLLLPKGDDSDPKRFEGEVSKTALVEFFSQVTPPHPDAPPPASAQASDKSKLSKSKPKAAEESLEPDSYPQHPKESPDPNVARDAPKPVQVPIQKADITRLDNPDALQKACLHAKSTTCIIAVDTADTLEALHPVLEILAEIAGKHSSRGTKLFPIYSVSDDNAEYKTLVDGLELAEGSQVLAVNAKRGWYSVFDVNDPSSVAVETWIDGIRLGDFKKQKMPDGLGKELEEEPTAEKADREDEDKVRSEGPPVTVVEETAEEVVEAETPIKERDGEEEPPELVVEESSEELLEEESEHKEL